MIPVFVFIKHEIGASVMGQWYIGEVEKSESYRRRSDVLSTVLLVLGGMLMSIAAAIFLFRFFAGGPVETEPYLDGTLWHVSYVKETYNDGEANWDGTLSEWRDDYFIAHDWSRQGREIASMPEYAEVDDEVYAFDGTSLFAPGATTDAVYGTLGDTADDVFFQVCDGDMYRVVRYVPVDNADAVADNVS